MGVEGSTQGRDEKCKKIFVRESLIEEAIWNMKVYMEG
jgi:hypothetical protein